MIELANSDLPADDVVHDDLLRLIFTCCHPTLSPPTRVALALRTLCGLSPAQIAGVLLTTEAATTKRLTRARQKIAAAHIPYRVPAEDELADRLPAVCAVIHSLYTAGHAPVDGQARLRCRRVRGGGPACRAPARAAAGSADARRPSWRCCSSPRPAGPRGSTNTVTS